MRQPLWAGGSDADGVPTGRGLGPGRGLRQGRGGRSWKALGWGSPAAPAPLCLIAGDPRMNLLHPWRAGSPVLPSERSFEVWSPCLLLHPEDSGTPGGDGSCVAQRPRAAFSGLHVAVGTHFCCLSSLAPIHRYTNQILSFGQEAWNLIIRGDWLSPPSHYSSSASRPVGRNGMSGAGVRLAVVRELHVGPKNRFRWPCLGPERCMT